MASAGKRAKVDATLPDFSKSFDTSDVTIVFDDGRRLHFNRGGLAFQSPVFHEMLLGNWKEGSDRDAEIKLPNKSCDVFHTLLRLTKMYKETLITDDNVVSLLSLADEYEISSISAYCGEHIIKHWRRNGLEKEIEAIDLAAQYDLRAVLKAFLPALVCRPLDELQKAAATLSPSVYAAIMQMRSLRQAELFDALFLLKCYPTCATAEAKSFVCHHCGGRDRACATGFCATETEKSSRCGRCKSMPRITRRDAKCNQTKCSQYYNGKALVCYSSASLGGVGRLCACGIDCDDWLENEVVAMLLKRKA